MNLRKKSFWLFLILTLGMSISNVALASTETKLYVHPSIVSAFPGETFTIDIAVSNVDDLWAWELSLAWNSTILDFESIDFKDTWFNLTQLDIFTQYKLYEDSVQTSSSENATSISVACTTKSGLDVFGATGSGTLVFVSFQVKELGEGVLDLSNTTLVDSTLPLGPIAHTVEDAYFSSMNPVALFTYTPEIIGAGDVVTFDASASFDPKGGNIVNYTWNFGDENITTVSVPVITHVYSVAQTYEVNLTVTDSQGLTGFKVVDLTLIFAYDIAIVDVALSSSEVTVGDVVSITVNVTNLGSRAATFDVTVYYEEEVAAPAQTVSDLASDASQTLSFSWDTTGVADGTYRIKAVAALEDDEDTENNTYIDGTVKVEASAQSFPIEYIAIIGIVGVAAVVGIVLFMRRRG